jgi:4-amino-4-deoxy-L-arabinose transferase-like glycosyltransferase
MVSWGVGMGVFDSSRQEARRGEVLLALVLMIAALAVSTYGQDRSGPLWPDAPRHANVGAMIHDWLRPGDWFRLYHFAKANYATYPAFSIPYHPPVYPLLLGLAFLVGGVSYAVARFAIGVFSGLALIVFQAIQRCLGARPVVAFGCALLLMTTPEFVRWSRDTMSEVPSTMMILAASWLF